MSSLTKFSGNDNSYDKQINHFYNPSNDEKMEIAKKQLASSTDFSFSKETTSVELNEKNQFKTYEQVSKGTLKTADGRKFNVTKTVKVEEDSTWCTVI